MTLNVHLAPSATFLPRRHSLTHAGVVIEPAFELYGSPSTLNAVPGISSLRKNTWQKFKPTILFWATIACALFWVGSIAVMMGTQN